MIATTSSNQKAEKLKKLGADHTINYKTDPNWGETARKLTSDGAGVDHIMKLEDLEPCARASTVSNLRVLSA